MTVIAAPTPRSPCPSRLLDGPRPSALLPPIQLRVDHPRIAIPLPRTPSQLLSPIQISHASRLPLSIQRSASPCSPTPRRRRVAHAHRAPRPRRSHGRADCFIISPSDRFDLLPWISVLDAAPANDSGSVADLSQLDLDATSAGGPVRRRKTSLRSSPMAKPSELAGGALASPFLSGSGVSLPSIDAERTAANPRTPEPVVRDPSLVLFHNLMPVLPCDTA